MTHAAGLILLSRSQVIYVFQNRLFTLCISKQSIKGLVTNYGEGGGVQNRRGAHMKFYPYEKRGGGVEKF